MKIHDVAGVFNLHGVPGFIGGLLSAIFRAVDGDGDGWRQVVGSIVSVAVGLSAGALVGYVVKHFNYY